MPNGMTRCVLVTGAQGALGGHVARRFQKAGVKVIGLDHKSDPAVERSLEGVRWLRANLADPAEVKSALAPVAGEVDALVHCAGGFRFSHVAQLTDADFSFLIDANLKSSFHLARELLPGMVQRGYGRLLFVSARATLQPGGGMGAYAATKAGINALVAVLAEETRKTGVNVNAVLPSIIDTPANRKDMPGADPAGWVKPEQLAEILFSLTQPYGDALHGALIPVSGRV
jgi:NAD(P)-dependent dehydrogenase (short-subunit alcohol dehydrogenase family)